MALASEVVNDALALIGVKRTGRDVTTDEMSDGIRAMNDYATMLEAEGLFFGYAKAGASTDDINVPDWTLTALKYNLAMRLAPNYGVPVSQEVALGATTGIEAVERRLMRIPEPFLPTTLPIGAGQDQSCIGSRFFAEADHSR